MVEKKITCRVIDPAEPSHQSRLLRYCEWSLLRKLTKQTPIPENPSVLLPIEPDHLRSFEVARHVLSDVWSLDNSIGMPVT